MAKPKQKIKKSELRHLKQLRIFEQLVAGLAVLVLVWQIPAPRQTEIVTTPSLEVVRTDMLWQLPIPAPIPVANPNLFPPLTTAKGVYVVDPVSKVVLYQKNPTDMLLPASTTKIMTAIIAVETYDPQQLITIAEEENTIGNTLKLKRGEVLTAQDLLAGVLINSANDAALALAIAYPETGYSGFIQAMNKKAKALGLNQTQFKNVSGVESVGHVTSAQDMATLSMYALSIPEIKNLVSVKTMDIYNQAGQLHRLSNTNQLLGEVEGLYGVKTGWTENAGECLVSVVKRDQGEVLVVVLGSQDRFGESKALIEWAYANHTWVEPREYLESYK